MYSKDMNTKQLAQKLYRECRAWGRAWSSGMFLEIYYTPENDKVTFSSGMHGNSWTNDPEKIGILRYMTPSECLEYAETLMISIEEQKKAMKVIEK